MRLLFYGAGIRAHADCPSKQRGTGENVFQLEKLHVTLTENQVLRIRADRGVY